MNLIHALRHIASRKVKNPEIAKAFLELANVLEQQQKDEDEFEEKLRDDLSSILDPNQ